jgi:cyclohexyl-isocyanide hydratase
MIIGMLIFPGMTPLDFVGPYEVFSQLPGAEIRVVWRSLHPVTSKGGLQFLPDTTIDGAPLFDILFVPGGPGVGDLMEDRELLEFLRLQAHHVRYITSVCTGALLLGAAGLLKGYRATTHWLSLDLLPVFGATAVADRVVIDCNRITGGGITAGIDFALTISAELFGPETAKMIELLLEYNPAPPFSCGHPTTADPAIVERFRARRAELQATRLEQAQRAALLYCR